MDESNTRLSAKRLVFVFVETKLTFPKVNHVVIIVAMITKVT